MQLNVPVGWRFQTLDTLLLSTVSSTQNSHLQKNVLFEVIRLSIFGRA